MSLQDALYIPVRLLQDRLSFVETDPLPWKESVIVVSWARQYRYYSKQEAPPNLKKFVPHDKFVKSQAYGKDKAKFSFFKTFYSQIWETIFIYYGGFALCWDWAGQLQDWIGYYPSNQILQSIGFSMIYAFISSITSLPLSVYSTFVLEEKHGFNKTTPSIFLTDMLKGWLVGFLLGTPFLWAFLSIFNYAAVLTADQTRIPDPYGIPISYGDPTALQQAHAIAGRTPAITYRSACHPPQHIVVYDTLIKNAKVDGVEAVLAHELGHWYYYHPTKLMLIMQIHTLGIIACFPAFLQSTPLLLSFDFPASVAVHPPVLIAFLLYQAVLTPLDTIVTAGMHAISRHFEFEADRFACELHQEHAIPGSQGMGKRLGEALISIMIDNLATLWIDP
ncbi:11764_t:CDS:2, partial [Acaulospora colombiana]